MQAIKRIAVIGAGALGVLYGNRFCSGYPREDVIFIADEARVRRYRDEGIYFNGTRCDFNFVSPEEGGAPVDLVLFSVKYGALPQAIEQARPFVHPETIFVSSINGISSERDIAQAFGKEHVLYCVAQEMDAVKTQNHIASKKFGVLLLGSADNTMTEDLRMTLACMDRAGIPYRLPEDIHFALWSKLMFNDGINQVCAIYRLTYGEVIRDVTAYHDMIEAMRETAAIAAHEGVILGQDEIDAWMGILARLTPESIPSMLQDTLAGRKTELGLFAGTVCALGRKYGVPTPVNDRFYEIISEREKAQ